MIAELRPQDSHKLTNRDSKFDGRIARSPNAKTSRLPSIQGPVHNRTRLYYMKKLIAVMPTYVDPGCDSTIDFHLTLSKAPRVEDSI